MFYVLLEMDYDEVYGVTVFQGPDGLGTDLGEIREDFFNEFNHRKLGPPNLPEYKGPATPFGMPGLGSLVSGAIFHGGALPTPGPEYEAWRKECQRATDEWNARRETKIKEWALKYPGDDLVSMFKSFLKVKYGLVEVESRHFFA